MGGAFLGPFVAGLSGTLQQAQQRQTEQEYKKALVEHSKLQTKMLENKLNLADQEQALLGAYMARKGYPMPSPAPAQIAQPEQQPQSLLGRLFNPQPSMPQPAATQPSLPQAIAQGQMQGQIPGMKAQGQPDDAFMEDLLQKKLFDMPPFRQRLEAESKQIGRAVTTMGPNGPMTVLLDKMGRPMGSMPTVPEYGSIKTKGMQGEEYEQFYPKSSPPGFVMGSGPGGVMTAPPPQMIPQGMPDSVKQKVTDLEIFKNQMQSLKEMGQNPKVFGLWANTAAKIADSPVGALMPADPDVLAFHKAIKNIENIKVHQFGGSNLTSTELARALASLPRTYNQQDFNTAVDQTIKAADADVKDYYKAYAQPEAMKGVQGGLGPRPQLPGQTSKEWVENGVRYRINPQTGKKQRWVQ